MRTGTLKTRPGSYTIIPRGDQTATLRGGERGEIAWHQGRGDTAGFEERLFAADEVTLNYVVGPANGLPLLLIPGQMKRGRDTNWSSRRFPNDSCLRHRSSRPREVHADPGRYSYNICGSDCSAFCVR